MTRAPNGAGVGCEVAVGSGGDVGRGEGAMVAAALGGRGVLVGAVARAAPAQDKETSIRTRVTKMT